MDGQKFNKKIFAILLEKAKGSRSWRQFAEECDISYVQMRKLAQGIQSNSPRPKLIKKIADHAFDEIDFEDLLFATGISIPDKNAAERKNTPSQTEIMLEKYRSMPASSRKFINDFIDFILEKNKG